MSTATSSSPAITTIAVELSVIKIGNKQMTISVFNQLYEEECWDNKHNIIYPIWGKVLREGKDFIIFQKGGDLRKVELPEKEYKKIYEAFLFRNTNWKEFEQFIPRDGSRYNKDHPDKDVFSAIERLNMLYLDLDYRMSKEQINTIISWTDKVHPKIFDKIKEAYRSYSSNTDKYNRMVDELKSSKQLFIAV